MNILHSTLKIILGLSVFASLMFLEFTSYTRAVAESVPDEQLIKSQNVEPNASDQNVKIGKDSPK